MGVMFYSLNQLEHRSHLFFYWIVPHILYNLYTHCTNGTNWNISDEVQVTRAYIFVSAAVVVSSIPYSKFSESKITDSEKMQNSTLKHYICLKAKTKPSGLGTTFTRLKITFMVFSDDVFKINVLINKHTNRLQKLRNSLSHVFPLGNSRCDKMLINYLQKLGNFNFTHSPRVSKSNPLACLTKTVRFLLNFPVTLTPEHHTQRNTSSIARSQSSLHRFLRTEPEVVVLTGSHNQP